MLQCKKKKNIKKKERSPTPIIVKAFLCLVLPNLEAGVAFMHFVGEW